MSKDEIRQIPRVVILFIYVAILFLINWIVFDQWYPPFGVKGFWFYASLLSLLLGSHLITPYYNKPVDAIAYGVPAFIALMLINAWGTWNATEKTVFLIGMLFCLIVAIVAFVSILLKDSKHDFIKNISECCRYFSDYFGSPKVVYSVVLLLSLYLFHRQSARELFFIGIAWALTVALHPCETLYRFFKKVKSIWSMGIPSHIVGEIAAYQIPGIVLIRQRKQKHLPFATPLLINDPQTSVRVGVSLDYVGRDEGILLRAIEIRESINPDDSYLNLATAYENSVLKLEPELSNSESKKIQDLLPEFKQLVGIVAPETSVERLYFEVVQESDIEEGTLVETIVGKDKVLYQIVDGLTKEEIVSQKNTFGYARAQAQKIGIWNEEERKFIHAKWLPQLNAP